MEGYHLIQQKNFMKYILHVLKIYFVSKMIAIGTKCTVSLYMYNSTYKI